MATATAMATAMATQMVPFLAPVRRNESDYGDCRLRRWARAWSGRREDLGRVGNHAVIPASPADQLSVPLFLAATSQ
jgi:hypothetical protein